MGDSNHLCSRLTTGLRYDAMVALRGRYVAEILPVPFAHALCHFVIARLLCNNSANNTASYIRQFMLVRKWLQAHV